jgi:hypothetical protein
LLNFLNRLWFRAGLLLGHIKADCDRQVLLVVTPLAARAIDEEDLLRSNGTPRRIPGGLSETLARLRKR